MNQTKEALAELQSYVTDRIRTDGEIFKLAEDNLAALTRKMNISMVYPALSEITRK